MLDEDERLQAIYEVACGCHRTMKLYDRRSDEVSLDDVEQILI